MKARFKYKVHEVRVSDYTSDDLHEGVHLQFDVMINTYVETWQDFARVVALNDVAPSMRSVGLSFESADKKKAVWNIDSVYGAKYRMERLIKDMNNNPSNYQASEQDILDLRAILENLDALYEKVVGEDKSTFGNAP